MQESNAQNVSPIYLLIAQHLHFFGQPVDPKHVNQAVKEIIGDPSCETRRPPKLNVSGID